MKRLLIIVLMLVLLPVHQAFAAQSGNVDAAAESFKIYCAGQMKKILDTYKGTQYSIKFFKASNTPEHWTKISDSVAPEYNCYVKEISPSVYQGILEVKMTTVYYDDCQSEKEAIAENNIRDNVKNIYRFFLTFQNDQWVVTEANVYSHWRKKWHKESITDIFEALASKNEIKE